MVENIKNINKSWKYEGYLYVFDNQGKNYKRKYREYTRGKFAGRIGFNVWDNVFTFERPSDWDNDETKNHYVYPNAIKHEGKYTELYNVSKRDRSKGGNKEEKVEEKPKEEEKVEEKVFEVKDVKHSAYEEIKEYIDAGEAIYLVGPAGSGKNHVLKQVSEELGMNFYFSNSIQQEHKLVGYEDANGTYHPTEFYKACTDESECIFFLDEMDASIPEVLVLINAAIANGYFEFPNGKIDNIKHVHFVAAGNTFGDGADEQYTGRMVLDQATLDRFSTIEFGYCEEIELMLAEGNKELVNFVRDMRKQAEEKGIRATFSYRCITAITKMEKKLGLEKVLKNSMFKGMDRDTLATLNTSGGITKYYEAMRKMVVTA